MRLSNAGARGEDGIMQGRTWGKLGLVVGLASIGVVAAPSQPAHAATINVTTTNDEENGTGSISLREAVITANFTAEADVINVPAGIYQLDLCGAPEGFALSGDLDLRGDVTIRGATAATTVIDQTCAGERVIDVIGDSVAVFEDITVTGGDLGSNGGNGGGIAALSAGASITVRDSVVTGNAAGDGGASDAWSGGGIYIDRTGTLLIERSTISDNTVGSGGSGTLGWKAAGGGVALRGFSGTPGSVTIIDSTISGNVGGVAARGGGGGLWLETGDVTLTDVDVTNNSTASDATGRAAGDGAGVAIIAPTGAAITDLNVDITGGEWSGNTIGTPAAGGPEPFVMGGRGGGLFVGELFTGFDFTGAIDIDGTVFDANEAGDGAVPATGLGTGGTGGNIYIDAYSTETILPVDVTIRNATISNGVAGSSVTSAGGNGGGAYVNVGTASLGSSISIIDSTFDGNRAGAGSPGGAGGGLYAWSASSGSAGAIDIIGSTFTDNQAGDGLAIGGGSGGFGGGAWLYNPATGQTAAGISVFDSMFTGNVAGDGGSNPAGTGGFAGNGGGASAQSEWTSIGDSTFDGNRAGDGGAGSPNSKPGGDGGGVAVIGDQFDLTGSTFRTNSGGIGGFGGASSFGGSGGAGGAVWLDVSAHVNIANSLLTANAAGDGGDGMAGGGDGGQGGGLYGDGGSTTYAITDSTVTDNQAGDGGTGGSFSAAAGGFGGGVLIRGVNVTAEFDSVDVVGNAAGDGGAGPSALGDVGGYGGGVGVLADGDSASLTIIESVIADNATGTGATSTAANEPGGLGGRGGGLYADVGTDGTGAVTIVRSSITGNTTGDGGQPGSGGLAPPGGSGAGAFIDAGDVTITNATIAGNATGDRFGGGSTGDGGGLFLNDLQGTATIDHVTIAGNTGKNGDNLITAADIDISRSVIADPAPDGSPSENCNTVPGGTITSLGDNAEGEGNDCDFVPGTDLIELDELLGPLQDNGGPGLTRAPRIFGPSSGALIDYIAAGDCSLTIDQRGVSRPQGDGCDVGAVESNPSIVAKDDVFRVGPSTFIDFVANDVPTNASLADTTVTLVRQPDQGALLLNNDGQWRYVAPQASGAYTDFEYRVCLGVTDAFCDTATVTLIPADTSRFVSLNPARVFDTRPAEVAPGPKGKIPAGGTIDVQITGVAGVPASGVSAIALNVTATETGAPGFVTAYATGTVQPPTSNLNIAGPGTTIPNFVIVPVGAGGKVTFFSLQETHLLADVAGYFTESGVSMSSASPGSAAGRLVPIDPVRVFDTRPGEPAAGPKGFVAHDQTIDVQIAGAAGVPPTGAAAVVMNLTITESGAPGFVTAYPKGTTQPLASNLNVTGPFQTAANLVVVPIGADGRISLYSYGGGHLLGDVTGYITAATAPVSLDGLFVPMAPDRVFDTRPAETPPGPKGYVDAGETIVAGFSGVAGIPASGVGAVALNVTATESGGPGHITVWPDGIGQPNASTLNLTGPGQTRPNAAVIPLGDGGRLKLFAFGGAHLLTDTFGWFLG